MMTLFASHKYRTVIHDYTSICAHVNMSTYKLVCFRDGKIAYFRLRHGSHETGGRFRFSILPRFVAMSTEQRCQYQLGMDLSGYETENESCFNAMANNYPKKPSSFLSN